MNDRDRFESIRARYLQAGERENKYRESVLLPRYARMNPPDLWLTKSERDKLESFDRAQNREVEKMFALLDRVSPRYWRAGVAMWWVMERLAWEDATTSDALSVTPQPGYGYSTTDAEQFAKALTAAA